MIPLNENEFFRYQSQINLMQIKVDGQVRLKNSKVLVIGAGALGVPILQYLNAMGIGTIGIVDFDRIELSNLHRQTIYSTSDIGKYKSLVITKKLAENNPETVLIPYNIRLTNDNADIFSSYDVIVDATDNFETKYLINDAAYFARKPVVYGSVFQFEGYVSVFNQLDKKTAVRGPNYRDLFHSAPSEKFSPNCSEAGIIPTLPGIIGLTQANEVMKILLDIGQTFSGKLFVYDGLQNEILILPISKNPNNPLSKSKILPISNYYTKKKLDLKDENSSIEITSNELKEILSKKNILLVDIRSAFQHQYFNIGGINISPDYLEKYFDSISIENKVIVFYCQYGISSTHYAKLLKMKHQMSGVSFRSLKGGINRFNNS